MTHRTFLIIGAARGVGLTLARRLAIAGVQVVGLARRASEFPGELATVDLDHRGRTAAVLEHLASRYDFDGVVNNVDKAHRGSLAELDEVLAPDPPLAVLAVQALLPGMLRRGWGRIVTVASLNVSNALECAADAADKAALMGFRSWALELAQRGITVNCVAPGGNDDRLLRSAMGRGAQRPKHRRAPLPTRRAAKPDEVAAAVQFLLGEEAGFITGQTLFVDGGASIGKALL